MTVWTPDWKLTVAGTEYTNLTISDITHQAGRDDIYAQFWLCLDKPFHLT
jgi:hypothetical protein